MLRRSACLPLALGVVVAGLSCRSTGEHRADADREVYEILVQRRAALGAGDPFTIDPPERSLRQRILAGELAADGLPPLDLADCLEIAAENSREYQDRRETLYLAALDLTLERWDFSVQKSGSFGAFLSGDGNEARDTGVLSTLGISKLLGTGARILGDASIDLARDVSRGDGWEAVSNLSLSITQPLLRGFGERIVREPLTQSERDVVYAARAYERFRRTFTYDVASRYYRLRESYNRLDNERANNERTVVLRRRNEEFARAGRISDIEVDQARQNELSAQTRVVEAERSLEADLDDFKFFLGLPIEIPLRLDLADTTPLLAEEVLELEIAEDEAVAVALAGRLDHLTVLDRVADAERRLAIAADGLRAGLGLSLSAGAASDANDLGTYRRSNMDWQVGLDLDLPWNQLPERNAYRSALITLDATRRAADESGDGIRQNLRDARRTIEAARTSLEIETGAVALAERRVESAQLNLEAGRANTRDVTDAHEDLVQAENQLIRARTDYTLAGLALFRDMELIRVEGGGIEVDLEPLQRVRNGERP
ncbi:MAG: TolC family protein [Planctomycetota bacterium]